MNLVKRIAINLVLVICSAGIMNYSCADEPARVSPDEKVDIKYFFDKADVLSYLTKPVKQGLAEKKYDLSIMAGAMQGYDNNVFLDPRRDKDAYLETSVSVDTGYRYTKDIRMNMDFDIYDITYYNYTDNDMYDMSLNPGFEMDFLDDRLTFQPEYMIDWTWFPHDSNASFYSHKVSLFMKNKVFKKFYQRIGARLEYRNYTGRKTYGPNAVKKSELEVHQRYTGEYEFNFTITKKIRLRQNLQGYRNDSNNQYYDYYDYNAFRSKTTLTVFFTDKLYSITGFTYTRKKYDDRLSTKDDVHQKDDLFLFSASVFYDITASFTLNASYSYRENVSNEPLEKYSGSLMSIGLYYVF